MDKEETNPAEENDTGELDRDPVFYYSREHRLRRATPMVRELNEGKPLRPNLRKTIFGTKSNTMLFLLVMIICAALFIMNSRLFRRDDGMLLGGNRVTVAVRREEGIAVMDLVKKAPKSGEVYLGPVEIAVSPVLPRTAGSESTETPPVFVHRIIFNPVDTESFRVTLPFEEKNFYVILRTNDEMKSFRL